MLLLISYGEVVTKFSHASCFIYKPSISTGGSVRDQIMLYDPKNAQGIYCMKRSEQESLNDRDDLYVNTRRDIDHAAYYYHELYALEPTEVL